MPWESTRPPILLLTSTPFPLINWDLTLHLGVDALEVVATFVKAPYALTKVSLNAPLSDHLEASDRDVDQMNSLSIRPYQDWATNYQIFPEEFNPVIDLDNDQLSQGLVYPTGRDPFRTDESPFLVVQMDDKLVLDHQFRQFLRIGSNLSE